jgi:lipoate-protein ligase A
MANDMPSLHRLPQLNFWHDTTSRPGSLNMALDESMLLSAREPWMRVYQWSEPTISIGFSQETDRVLAEHRGWPLVRRWTGGGVVVHDGDWTYTLAAPQGSPLCEMRATESYRLIHEAMVAALGECGITDCQLQPESTSDGMGVCFVEPAKFDVVQGGQKIAGAAQRRTKAGFLHQGTVQPLRVPIEFGVRFAKQLAQEVSVISQVQAETTLLSSAQDLTQRKYGTAAWTQHRSVLELYPQA